MMRRWIAVMLCAGIATGAMAGGGELPSLKVGLREAGVYTLPASEIAAAAGTTEADVAARIGAGGLALSHRGTAVAYVPEDGNAGIAFYGEAIDSQYTDENVYRLTWADGLTMAAVGGVQVTPGDGTSTFAEALHVEQNRYSMTAAFTDPAADYWFWDYVVAGNASQGTKSFLLSVRGVASESSDAVLTIHLQGSTSSGVANEHHVVASLNGTTVGEVHWSGARANDLKITFDQALLREGDNTVSLTGVLDPGVPYSVVYLESFDLEYKRLYAAVGNQLLLRGDGNKVVTVYGFTTPDAQVLDVSDPHRPVRVAATVDEVAGAYRASFEPSGRGVPYMAVAGSSGKTVASLTVDAASSLASTSNEAKYVIITVPSLAVPAQALASYRQGQGLSSQVVLLEDIYDEFNDGIADPRAIQTFLAFAGQNWKTPPQYVALAGEGTYDYKNHRGYGGNLLPPVMVGTPQGLFASDTWLADANGDGVPEMAVGRLPALTAEELQRLVDRIVAYEAGGDADWRKRVVLAADNADTGGDFPAASRAVAAGIPADYAVQTAYLGEVDLAAARDSLKQAVNGGAAWVNYFGHSGLDRLAQEGLLTTADVPTLTNSNQLPVITAMSCVVGQFPVPGYDCLGKVLLLSESGGGIAVWAPTGLSLNEDARVLSEGFYGALFHGGKHVLGDAILSAMSDYAARKRTRYISGIYNLLGDPALHLHGLPAADVADGPPDDKPPSTLGGWKQKNFTPAEQLDPAISSDTADPDDDGISNLIEYALGGHPRDVDTDMSLALDPEAGNNANEWYDAVITYQRNKLATDVDCRIEVTDDLLGQWKNDPGHVVVTGVVDDGNGETETVTVQVRSPAADRGRMFVRLAVRKL